MRTRAPHRAAPGFTTRTMTDFAPLSSARRWAPGSGDKPLASLGRLELKKQLGRGAQATVWLALDPHLQRKAAIKLMRPMQDQDPSVLEQWRREARQAGRLARPLHRAGVRGRWAGRAAVHRVRVRVGSHAGRAGALHTPRSRGAHGVIRHESA